jgi:hypothetical protein
MHNAGYQSIAALFQESKKLYHSQGDQKEQILAYWVIVFSVFQKKPNLGRFFSQTNLITSVARWIVFKPKIQIWVNFEGLAMEDDGIFYGLLVRFTVLFILYANLVYFSPLWYFVPRKIWQPC